jgi:hypothetical protein
LTVYFGPNQIFREEIKFTRQAGYMTAEEIGGKLEKNLEIPAGEHEVKAQFINVERAIDAVDVVRGQFPTGRVRTLAISLDETGHRLDARIE